MTANVWHMPGEMDFLPSTGGSQAKGEGIADRCALNGESVAIAIKRKKFGCVCTGCS